MVAAVLAVRRITTAPRRVPRRRRRRARGIVRWSWPSSELDEKSEAAHGDEPRLARRRPGGPAGAAGSAPTLVALT